MTLIAKLHSVTTLWESWAHGLLCSSLTGPRQKRQTGVSVGKGEDLANRFEQANADFIRAVEAVSDERWTGKAPDEDRPRGAIAHHVASSIPILVG